MVLEHVGHQLGQREHAEHHADGQPEQESAVNLLPKSLEVSFEERFPGLFLHEAVQRLDDLLVDARDQGDGAAGDARHHVGGAHEEALERDDEVVNEFHLT